MTWVGGPVVPGFHKLTDMFHTTPRFTMTRERPAQHAFGADDTAELPIN